MTATVSSGPLAERRRWRASLAAAVGIGSLLFSGADVSADQTVDFDAAASDAPHISLVGDSTLTGVRWYADYGSLERFNFVLSAESCRRTIEQSCISREGYRSQNVITAMRTLDGRLGEVLVVMSGYNDPAATIDEAIEGVVDEAREQDVDHVVWLSLRTSDDVDYSDPQEQSSTDTFREYNQQLHAAAAASDGYLQIADWATYSNGAPGWFEGDGVHLTPRGVDALTGFITAAVERVLAGDDVSPAEAPWSVLAPGAEGPAVVAVQDALIAAGIDVSGGADGVFGNDTMSAVAEYQRQHGTLQVTGAVDVATATALGIHDDPDAAPEPTVTTTTVAASTGGAAAAPAAARADVAAEPIGPVEREGTAVPRWPVVAAAVAVVVAIALIGRRRAVVAQRAARRWARVHPATSPRRSVADLRRAGELPAVGARSALPYDHAAEDGAPDEREVAAT